MKHLALLLTLLLTSCASVPLTSMYKLYRLSPMEADPSQIKIAIRAHENLGIPHGGAQIQLSYKTHDQNTYIDDIYLIDIVKNAMLTPELTEDMKVNEAITVLQLTPPDAKRMKQIQNLVKADKANDIEGQGSLGVSLNGICLRDGNIPPDYQTIDIFMQTSNQDGYFVFTEDFDLTQSRPGWDADLTNWPKCADD